MSARLPSGFRGQQGPRSGGQGRQSAQREPPAQPTPHVRPGATAYPTTVARPLTTSTPGQMRTNLAQLGFDDEFRQLDLLDEDPESWDAAYCRIREAVRLLAPDGRPVPEFLLHI
jgi:hypothetical protein